MANAALDLDAGGKVRDADELPDNIALAIRRSRGLRERLKEALLHGDRQRAVIVLHDVEGFTHGEIGRTLGIPEGMHVQDLSARTSARLLQNIRSTS